MNQQEISLHCSDGAALAATLSNPDGAPRGVVVIAGALGVPRRFYAALANWLADQGYAALYFDYRGTGDSVLAATPGRSVRMQHWGEQDIDAAIRAAAERSGGARVFLLGHSAGGQLIGLAAASEQLAGAILVAATAPNWKKYPFPDRFGMFAVWHLMIPLVAVGRDTFPARKLGISTIDVPSGVMKQWAQWARSPDYLFSPRFGIDTGRYPRLSLPLLSLGFDDDGYASPAAIDALLEHYPAASIDHREVAVSKLGIGGLGHFGYFRDKCRDSLWSETLAWLEQV